MTARARLHQARPSTLYGVLHVGPSLEQCTGTEIVSVLDAEHQSGRAFVVLRVERRPRLEQCAGAALVAVFAAG